MYFAWLVGSRHLRTRREGSLASLIALIAMLGVCVGVAALIIVISVMNGFERDLAQKILGTNAHIRIVSAGGSGITDTMAVCAAVERVPGVLAAAPVADGEVLLRANGRVQGAKLRGIAPAQETRVTDIGRYLTRGTLEFPRENGIILGEELAQFLGVTLGDRISVVSPEMMLTPVGMAPRMAGVEVTGLFRSGMYEYDCVMAYAPLPLAARLLTPDGRATAIEVKTVDPMLAQQIARAVGAALNHRLLAKSWQQINHSLFAAIRLEKVTMFVILTLIVFVAAFNVAGSLIMMVIEKTADVGVMRAFGVSRRTVLLIFLGEGMMIGAGGTLLGGLIGAGVCWFLVQFGLPLPSDVYYIDQLPVDMQLLDVSIVVAGTLLLTLLAAIYPAWRAARLDPVAAIRLD
ncbi:MAG TPA: ABC transporter permease [bacterium]|nr:ABC transporter permease [bacterium]